VPKCEGDNFLQPLHHTVYNQGSQSALIENGCLPSDVARTGKDLSSLARSSPGGV